MNSWRFYVLFNILLSLYMTQRVEKASKTTGPECFSGTFRAVGRGRRLACYVILNKCALSTLVPVPKRQGCWTTAYMGPEWLVKTPEVTGLMTLVGMWNYSNKQVCISSRVFFCDRLVRPGLFFFSPCHSMWQVYNAACNYYHTNTTFPNIRPHYWHILSSFSLRSLYYRFTSAEKSELRIYL